MTIRGYTFNVGDNVTLDQTKIEKTPAVGGDFAWLYATYQAERTGSPFEAFWNRLPPPLFRERKQSPDPLAHRFLNDPSPDSARRPSCGCRSSITASRDSTLAGDRRAGELLRCADRADSPTKRFPSRTRAISPDKTRPIPTTSGPAGR